MRLFPIYLLWQLQGWLVVGLVVAWLVHGFGLPAWLAVTVVALMVGVFRGIVDPVQHQTMRPDGGGARMPSARHRGVRTT